MTALGRGAALGAPRPPIAVTMGDPAGIGIEITLAAWSRCRGSTPFFLIADTTLVERRADGVPWRAIEDPREAGTIFRNALPVLHQPLAVPSTPGQPDGRNAQATIAAIDTAVRLTREGQALAVVTNPISKRVLQEGAGFAYPGHTEYLARLGGVPRTVMLLAGPSLRVVPVTIHLPLAEVPSALNFGLIVETAEITISALKADFGIHAPRIAVAGLNPHAGEGGRMGREEIDIIAPALDRLRVAGHDIAGPLPADTMFHAEARARYDVALTMYHDQGLVPLKALDFDRGVNVTLGLPFVRTSPDHGTAFDIAGRGVARPDSLIAALELAGSMAAQRAS